MTLEDSKLLTSVRTCATSANLGPGYDVAGLALDIYNEYWLYENTKGDYLLKIEGVDEASIPVDNRNLIIRTIRRILEKYSFRIIKGKSISKIERPLKIICKANIPCQKGMGSSSSAIVAGLLIANKVYDLNLSLKELFSIGVEIEAHPDNIAACLAGGLVVCYKNKSYEFEKITLPYNYKILLMIPGYKVDTLEARRLIPSKFLLDDCTYNISRFALLINSLREGNLEKAIIFIRDRLHQRYREKLFPRSMELVCELNERWGIPSAISGSGPSVIGVMDELKYREYQVFRNSIIKDYPDFEATITSINNKGSYYI